MPTQSKSRRLSVNYGFNGTKIIHKVGFVGAVLFVAAFYMLWGENPDSLWVLLIALLGIHTGLVLLVGAGAIFWVTRFGRFLLRDRLLDQIPWRGDEQVLDVGCGAGILLISAAKRLVTGHVIGVDLWTGDHGQTFTADTVLDNAKAEGVSERVSIKSEDARALDFPNETFDVVLSSFVLHHIDRPGRAAAVREMVRVLKPGGRIVLVDAQHTMEIVNEMRITETIKARRRRVIPFVPCLYWVTARKPRTL